MGGELAPEVKSRGLERGCGWDRVLGREERDGSRLVRPGGGALESSEGAREGKMKGRRRGASRELILLALEAKAMSFWFVCFFRSIEK